MRIQYSEGINFDWLNGWQCWTLASKNVRVEESNEMLTTCTIPKPIKIKVLWHQFSNFMFNLNYMCLLSQFSHPKYTNKFHCYSLITI